MKIGIFTLPLENNYGGNLQNYALQQTLKRWGHDVYTIDWHRNKKYGNLVHQLIGYFHRLYQYYIKKEKISICWSPFFSMKEFDIISSKIRPFLQENITFTDRTTFDQLEQIDKKYQFDAYVVGSDQVWVHSYSKAAFLCFVKREGVVKVAYAASSNESAWMLYPDLIDVCSQLSKDFNGLSVRESFLKEEAEKILNREVKLVLDPVFLLNKSQYQTLYANKQFHHGKAFGFKYILDESEQKTQIVNEVGDMLNIEFVSGMPKKAHVRMRNMNLHDYVFPSVEEWLEGICNAKFVITDSFHGMAFSILFNKNFAVIANAERGMGRFISLLARFNLEDRMVNTPEEAVALCKNDINYQQINRKIELLKKDSLDFLKNSLEV